MDAVDEVKARLSIEDVISEYVQLKRAGRSWKGLSPFTSEKTPSFVVSPEKQIWKDFSSGKGGSMFDFIMEVEGVDFKGALELLARKAGVDLDQFRSTPRSKGPDKKRLHDLLELATKFYQVQFSKNKVALEYVFNQRQFTKETALQWRLGYSPNNGSALVDYAKGKGYTERELELAGLTSKAYRGGIQDMFRGRLMIPLMDPQGQVVGFTARILEDDPRAPKYINTPQTPLYDKSRHIYGLNFAKETIRKAAYVVLVEGNLDVIASHQVGVRQVVATAGTALTEPQLKALGRFTGDIRLSFDADKAGVAATERAIPIASRVKVSLSIVDIPSGKDPDELIKQDPNLWIEAIKKHLYALDWLMARYTNLLDLDSAQGKRQYSDVLLPVVRALSDDVERDHYLNQIAETIKVSREALDQKLEKTPKVTPEVRQRRIKTAPQPIDKTEVENTRNQDNFLALMLLRPTLREFLHKISPDMLYTDEGRELLNFLKENPEFNGREGAKLVKSLENYGKIESLLYEELYQNLELNELHYEAARLQALLIDRYVKNENRKIRVQMAANPAAERELLARAAQLNQLRNEVKGAMNG